MKIQNWNPDFMDLSPIFAPFKHLKKYVEGMQDWPELSCLNEMIILQRLHIVSGSGKEICFVPPMIGSNHTEKKYEPTVYLTGQVQTRVKSWHDFFNALVWQIFPRAKSALNQIHYQNQLIESLNKIKHRSALRDAATHFDESGMIVVSSEKTLIQLLKKFEWKQLFWHERQAVMTSMRFFVFGHGLYENALNPYIGMTGKGVIIDVDDIFLKQDVSKQLQSIDQMLASFLLASLSSSADLTPIPLLGYPDWTKENTYEAYYENKKYFRDRH